MWETNRECLFRRWPDVLAALETAPEPEDVSEPEGTPVRTLSIGGIQLTSAYDRVAETLEQESLVPPDATDAWVYGLGLGDLARRLLTREGLRSVSIVVLSRSVAREVLRRFDLSDVLSDARVRLVLGAGEPDLRAPFAALPGELALAEEDCARLRDLVAVELAAPWVEERLAVQDAEFAAAIEENRARIATDGDVAELFGTRAGETVFVAGAGPSLADDLERLAHRSETLIAVDGALRTLLDAGVTPDVVVSVDAHLAGMARTFAGDLSPLAGSALVYFPVVPGEVLVRWPGRRLVAYGDHARWSAARREHPRGRLWVSGSVVHAAVDLAVRAGAARVVLIGCDFGLVGGRTHPESSHQARALERAGEAKPAGTWVLDVRGARLPSLPNLVGYLRDLERYIRAHPGVRFLNASRSGAAIEGASSAREVGLGL